MDTTNSKVYKWKKIVGDEINNHPIKLQSSKLGNDYEKIAENLDLISINLTYYEDSTHSNFDLEEYVKSLGNILWDCQSALLKIGVDPEKVTNAIFESKLTMLDQDHKRIGDSICTYGLGKSKYQKDRIKVGRKTLEPNEFLEHKNYVIYNADNGNLLKPNTFKEPNLSFLDDYHIEENDGTKPPF